MREKRYSKDMKGTQGKEETMQRFLPLKENLLFSKIKNNEIQQNRSYEVR